MITLSGNVLSASLEDREFVGKDGNKEVRQIANVLLLSPSGDGVYSARHYVEEKEKPYKLPETGKKAEIGPVVKYECFAGKKVAEVLF